MSDWFKANRLSINTKKTNFILFGYRKFVPQEHNISHEFNIFINNEKINQVHFTKFLGVIIDDKLTWQKHITSLASKISTNLFIVRRLKNVLSKDTFKMLYYTLFYPYFNYCSIIWGQASSSILKELIILQKGYSRN